ncbi:hypothetical protein K501DRAFT_211287 [Backusella circina FSU 941]|nr:hypothetical protein K501DRAFT_211287 [Backusella circina FSU 941]
MHTSPQNNSEAQPCSSQTMDALNSASGSDLHDQSLLLASPYTNMSNEIDSGSEDWKEFLEDTSSRKRPLPDDFDSSIYKDDSSLMEDGDDLLNKKPGRKPMTEDLFDDDEDPKVKRKAQNRAAQRAFRERKERYVKELEKKIKHVQDSHMLATAHLFQENQQLKAVIYRLELENFALKGISVDMVDMPEMPLKSTAAHRHWLPPSSLQQPPLSSLPTLAPIQIRPSPSTANSPSHPVPILPQQKKAKISPKNELPAKKKTTSLSNTATKGQNVDSSQQFTFSISTPATLRASANTQSSQTTEQIQMVPLYPDHSHPANQHFESKPAQPTSVGTITPILSPVTASSPVSVASYRSDTYSVGSKKDDESSSNLDTLLFGNTNDENKIGALLEPLFNTSEEFDISSLISSQTSLFN